MNGLTNDAVGGRHGYFQHKCNFNVRDIHRNVDYTGIKGEKNQQEEQNQSIRERTRRLFLYIIDARIITHTGSLRAKCVMHPVDFHNKTC